MSFHFTVETSMGVDGVVRALESSLKGEGFGVLWDFNLTGKLHEKGMDFNTAYRILEVCNPKEANKVLTVDKKAGYFLPCKIVVYEDSEETKVGMSRPTSLIGLLDNQELYNIANDIEQRLISSIKKALGQ